MMRLTRRRHILLAVSPGNRMRYMARHLSSSEPPQLVLEQLHLLAVDAFRERVLRFYYHTTHVVLSWVIVNARSL